MGKKRAQPATPAATVPGKVGKTRKKKRTHIRVAEEEVLNLPRSVVIPWGKQALRNPLINRLILDWRKVMLPHTAEKLKVVKHNKIIDFIKASKGVHYTHLIAFTKTDIAPYFKITRLPSGPSITFRIMGYTLCKEVLKAAKTTPLPAKALHNPPLVIMNNFTTEHLRLVSTSIQNMFPPIDVQSVRLADCRRVLLFNFDSTEEVIEVRHYQVKTRIATKKDDEAEDTFTSKGAKNKRVQVYLEELGPRMTLKIMKIQEGVFSGDTIHHSFINYTPEELDKIRQDMKRKKDLKILRKKTQEENVKRKQEEKERKKKGSKKQAEEDEEEEDAFETAPKAEEEEVVADDDTDPKAKKDFEELMKAYISKFEAGEDLDDEDEEDEEQGEEVAEDDDEDEEEDYELAQASDSDDDFQVFEDSDEDEGVEYMDEDEDEDEEEEEEESEEEEAPPKKKTRKYKN